MEDMMSKNPAFNAGFPPPQHDPQARDDSHSFPLDGLDLSSVSDKELRELFSTAPKLHDYGAVTVVRLSKLLVMKGGRGVHPGESRNMIFAAESLHLPVPKVHRAFTDAIRRSFDGRPEKAYFIVMDYVPGPTVEACWDSLELRKRQIVADQVAAMIDTMQPRDLQLPPGPIGGSDGCKFEGPWFTDYGAGPFATLKDLETWCNHKIDVCIRFKQLPLNTPVFQFQKVVFTHQDIAPRNLILDKQGTVWMLDWGLAGAYPPGFEQAPLRGGSWNAEFAKMVLERLSDRQEHVTRQFAKIAYGLSVAAAL
ncbi:Protein kinase-like domain protein [Niveomyces insectorum RCEF 264]|uniref:Protein kinase-like domain protein n=1 Tax=Niveomyces insectorum RCEF 264 TaxID=1081102 RepID=A0A167VL11_9HYPO|nr:Protein kinase-like domain protein [Niveomyces insectorum RCEF 264]